MSMKINSLNTVSFIAGFATCALVAAAVVANPRWTTTESAPTMTPVAQLAKYQPGTGEGAAQVRRARNEAMGRAAAESELVEACPRCR
jgi:hypothetical protein